LCDRCHKGNVEIWFCNQSQLNRTMFENSLNPGKIEKLNEGFLLTANPKTDFICKYHHYTRDDAAFFYTEQLGDFTLSAEVETIGSADYDAVFLMVRESEDRWIKLAVELGVDRNYNVVSVITAPWSDDANGELLSTGKCWLRITRKDDFWGLHYSTDGLKWRFVRAFGLGLGKNVMIGFGIQAPVGADCSGKVTAITLSDKSVVNFRDGS
jgi:regulation of enolase protein 1 (concanavalin A-like superfamily)